MTQLWNPDFVVKEGVEPGVARIRWSLPTEMAIHASPRLKVVPKTIRIGDREIPMAAERPQQSLADGEWLLDTPVSTIVAEGLEIEALVYFEEGVIPRLNRRGEVIEDPVRIEVPTMQADGTLLLPEHRWTRVITRTVRPSSPATIR